MYPTQINNWALPVVWLDGHRQGPESTEACYPLGMVASRYWELTARQHTQIGGIRYQHADTKFVWTLQQGRFVLRRTSLLDSKRDGVIES
jgi:transcriptional regulator GlxA family with amidase domain